MYFKESCTRADTEAKFFLHLIPADANDLPGRRRQHGFDNLDFDFDDHGSGTFDGKCLAKVVLPAYDIAGIRTGQYLANEDGSYTNLWEGEFPFGDVPATADAAVQAPSLANPSPNIPVAK